MNSRMNANLRVSLGITGWLVFVFCVLYVGAWFFSPGSYSRAEIYELEISKDSLIQIINEVKLENPDMFLSADELLCIMFERVVNFMYRGAQGEFLEVE